MFSRNIYLDNFSLLSADKSASDEDTDNVVLFPVFYYIIINLKCPAQHTHNHWGQLVSSGRGLQ